MNNRQKLLYSGALGVMAVLIMAVPATVSVYATQGPFINIGPPFDANSLATFTEGGTIHVVYEAPAGGGVYYGLVLSGEGGNSEELQDVPQKIIDAGTNPGLFVAAGKTFVVANNPGENEPNFATCNSDDDDCEEARPVGTDAPSEEVVITFASGVETYEDEETSDLRDSRNTFDSCNDGCDTDAFVVDPHPDYDTITGTQWISHSPDGLGQPNDVETYFAEFELPAGFTNPSITVDIHADNVATIFLNGDQIGQQPPGEISENFQDPVESFTNTTATLFNVGTNFLTFEVENFSDPSGLNYNATVTYQPGEIIITSFPTFSDIPSLQSVVYNFFFGTPQIPYAQATTCDPATSPQVTASPDAQDVYFVWEDCGEIMFQASHDGGDSFEEAKNLSNNAGISKDPRIALTGAGTVVVTWQDNTPGNEEIFYSRSTDGGETFNGGSPVGSPINLSNTNKKSDDHQLKALDDDVYVTWVDYKTGNGDIYFKASKDNDGASFGTTKNLSTNVLSFMSSRDPDLAAHDAMVSVIWTVHLDKNARLPGEIIFRESLNEGSTFGKQILVSKTLFKASKTPQVDYTDDGERYVAWLDKGGPVRQFIASGTFAVLASESEDGKTFTAAVNQSDSPDNLKALVDATLLEVVGDVTVFDPGSRRG